jgi:hypothetical protein
MAVIVNMICENCGKSFEVRKGKEKKTCSNECKKQFRLKKDEIFFEMKECQNCSKLFKSKIKENKKYCSYKCSGEAKHVNSTENRICLICGNEFKERIKYDKKFCSILCRNIWNNNIENKNNRIQKSKESLMLKYGVDSLFKLKSIQNKIKHNNHDSIKKARATIINKRNLNLIQRFAEINYKIIDFNNDNIKIQHPDGHIFENHRKLLVNRLNHNVELSTILLPVSAPKSTLELKIGNFLNINNVNYIANDRKLLKNLEIDILIPEKNIGIEINGLHWHSEYYVDKHYHINKLNKCNDINYDLLQFFEDEIIEKFNIVESIILNKLNLTKIKIFARKCEITYIDNITTKDFLEKNHIQGNVNGKYNIGLLYNNELVSIMTFGNLRNILGSKSNLNDYELLRFCNKLNTSVIGGASKLLDFFIKKNKPNKIITYANRRYSNGNLYEKLNFKQTKITPPNYFYVINKQRKHRFNFRKSNLIQEGFDLNKSEHEIMLDRKIPRIYDCGNFKYELIL